MSGNRDPFFCALSARNRDGTGNAFVDPFACRRRQYPRNIGTTSASRTFKCRQNIIRNSCRKRRRRISGGKYRKTCVIGRRNGCMHAAWRNGTSETLPNQFMRKTRSRIGKKQYRRPSDGAFAVERRRYGYRMPLENAKLKRRMSPRGYSRSGDR